MEYLSHTKSAGTKFSWKARIKSFSSALEGLYSFFKQEHNTWIHAIATMIVALMAIVLKINTGEAIAVSLAIGFVWAAELFNTAVERVMDFVSPEKNEKVKLIKDISAAAVLVAAISAFITGCLVFIPKI